MFKNYLKIAFRNLLRNKLFSALNILGLVIGMVACLLILQYVQLETSYDAFHKDVENVYRVRCNDYQNDRLVAENAKNYMSVGKIMAQDYPEVRNSVVIFQRRQAMLAYQKGNKRFKDKDLYFVADNFFDFFSFNLLQGNPKKVLKAPKSVVLTEKMAEKYFGNENPIGKTLELNGKESFTVTGVVQNPPVNSHLQFNFLLSIHDVLKEYKEKDREWTWTNFHVYVTLKPGMKPEKVEAKLPALVQKNIKHANTVKMRLQPLQDIHLNGYKSELSPSGDAQSIYLLLTIALFILVIAWINYVNLATARATDRAREVGIRKVVGAYRQQLIVQFLGEAFLINLLAGALTILFSDLLMPVFERFTGKDLPFNLWQQPSFWFIFGGMFVLGVLFSGLYPAFVLSGFKPVTVLKGKIIRSRQGIVLRKGLTLFQFMASIILIGGTLFVYQQLSFMRNKDLGLNISQTLIVEAPRNGDSTLQVRYNSFKQKVQQLAQVKSFVGSSSIPSEGFSAGVTGVKLKGQRGDGSLQSVTWIDEKYIPAYEMKIIAGRNFAANATAENEKNVIINESSAKLFGYRPQDILGKQVTGYGLNGIKAFTIVGVVKDFNQLSLKKSTGAAVMHYNKDAMDYYSIKVSVANMQQTIATIKKEYLEMFPKNTFEYYFLDAAFDAQYKADERFGEMFALFSGLAILVACLGLFGLASFTLLQRTKEMGIRKVLGASIDSLMILLLKDFLKPIVLAGLLALPLLYWGGTEWLKNYAYRMPVSWWLFVLPLLMVVLVALLTVGFQTLKATRHNPVEALRYE
ncbi:hypothetical protein BKI52_12810 [marine bacterium AO1-C]|nr:hypothetical protein BKI52_12810 [marine bacterium AO1-C]